MATEQEYDEIIAPMLAEIALKAGGLGMKFVACVEWAPDQGGSTSIGDHSQAGLSQSLVAIAAHSGSNIDAFLAEVVRRFDVSNSIYLHAFDKNATVPKIDDPAQSVAALQLEPRAEIISDGITVDLSNKDERAAIINLWLAMVGAACAHTTSNPKDGKSVAQYKLNQAINLVMPMLIRRAERAEAEVVSLGVENKRLVERLGPVDPGGSDQLDEYETAIDFIRHRADRSAERISGLLEGLSKIRLGLRSDGHVWMDMGDGVSVRGRSLLGYIDHVMKVAQNE